MPGSSVRGILQARILERVVISSSRASSWLRDRNHISCITEKFFPIWDIGEALFQILELSFPCWFHPQSSSSYRMSSERCQAHKQKCLRGAKRGIHLSFLFSTHLEQKKGHKNRHHLGYLPFRICIISRVCIKHRGSLSFNLFIFHSYCFPSQESQEVT